MKNFEEECKKRLEKKKQQTKCKTKVLKNEY